MTYIYFYYAYMLVTAALIININVLLVFIGVEDTAQVWLAGISLGVFLAQTIHQLFIKRVNFVIPSALAWASVSLRLSRCKLTYIFYFEKAWNCNRIK